MPDRQTINAAIERWVFGDDLERGGFPLESWRAEPRDFHTWDAVIDKVFPAIPHWWALGRSRQCRIWDATIPHPVVLSRLYESPADVLLCVLEALMPPAEFAKLMGDQP